MYVATANSLGGPVSSNVTVLYAPMNPFIPVSVKKGMLAFHVQRAGEPL